MTRCSAPKWIILRQYLLRPQSSHAPAEPALLVNMPDIHAGLANHEPIVVEALDPCGERNE